MEQLKLKRLITTPITTVYEDGIYGAKYEYLLNHKVGDLQQIFIKATLSTGNTANLLKSGFGLKLLKSARIHDGSSTIAMVNPYSQMARVDLMGKYDNLAKKIIGSTQPSAGAFLNNTFVYVYIPLMFFFSDKLQSALDLQHRDQLYLEIITNDSKEAMGMSVDFTSAKYEMACYYRRSFNELSVPRVITDSYSTFMEQKVSIAANDTDVNIVMTCPYPVFYLHFIIFRSDGSRSDISNVLIDIPSLRLMDMDSYINYTMADNTADDVNETMSLKFGERHGSEKRYIKFSQEMTNTNIKLTFSSSALTGTLYTVCEYYTNLINDGSRLINDVAGLFSS